MNTEKMEVLEKLLIDFQYEMNMDLDFQTNAKEYVNGERQSVVSRNLISSLFSPAQPTDDITITHVGVKNLESGEWMTTPLSHNTTNVIEPTGDINTWIEQEAEKSTHPRWMHSIEQWKAGANALYAHLQPKIAELESVLGQLVMLKNHKEAYGKTEDYLRLQPVAWEAAQQLMSKVKCDAVSDTTAADSKADADQQTSSLVAEGDEPIEKIRESLSEILASKEPAPTPIYDMKVISEAMSRPAASTEDWEKEFQTYFEGVLSTYAGEELPFSTTQSSAEQTKRTPEIKQ